MDFALGTACAACLSAMLGRSVAPALHALLSHRVQAARLTRVAAAALSNFAVATNPVAATVIAAAVAIAAAIAAIAAAAIATAAIATAAIVAAASACRKLLHRDAVIVRAALRAGVQLCGNGRDPLQRRLERVLRLRRAHACDVRLGRHQNQTSLRCMGSLRLSRRFLVFAFSCAGHKTLRKQKAGIVRHRVFANRCFSIREDALIDCIGLSGHDRETVATRVFCCLTRSKLRRVTQRRRVACAVTLRAFERERRL
eukprot:4278965-Pleurochrysis_carterae.AAC.2